MRVLVTGGAGLLGARLVADAPAGVEVHATWNRNQPPEGDVHRVDLADPEATTALIEQLQPDLVVHTAYAMADGAQTIVAASHNVALAAAEVGARLIHLSSDVVFDGEHGPYDETSRPMPISAYGRHKTEAESLVAALCPGSALVRTSLITWADPLDPRSAWVADTLRAGDALTLFTDERRCPVRLDDLAAQVWEIATLAASAGAGTWHLVGSEAFSRFDLGVLIARHEGLDPAGITGRSSRELRPARPRDLRLTTARSDGALSTPARSVRSLFAVALGDI